MTQSQQSTIHRAAVLVAALEPDLADRLLDQMPADEAARVRRAIMELGDVDVVQEREVIDAFLARDAASAAPSAARNDSTAVTAAQKTEDQWVELHLSSAASSQILCEDAPPAVQPFSFLHDVDRSQLAELLASERPQTIALVAARLSDDHAAALLAALAPATQAEVMRRFADVDATDPTVLAEIERSLRARLADCFPASARTPTITHQISRVLSATDVETKPPQAPDVTRSSVAVHAPAVSALPAHDPLALLFDDLEHLDAELLSATLRRADPELVRLALAGATASFVQKILNRLSLREAKALRRSIETLGPTRLSDMERAQHELARLAEQVLIEALQATHASQAAAI